MYWITSCPHYEQIMAYSFYEEDEISKQLIQSFQNYINDDNISIEERTKRLPKWDQLLYRYIKEETFFVYVQHKLKEQIKQYDHMFFNILELLEQLEETFLEDSLKHIKLSQWV